MTGVRKNGNCILQPGVDWSLGLPIKFRWADKKSTIKDGYEIYKCKTTPLEYV